MSERSIVSRGRFAAYDRDGNRAAARGAGCDEFVTKPCEPDDLRALLETMVRGRD